MYGHYDFHFIVDFYLVFNILLFLSFCFVLLLVTGFLHAALKLTVLTRLALDLEISLACLMHSGVKGLLHPLCAAGLPGYHCTAEENSEP